MSAIVEALFGLGVLAAVTWGCSRSQLKGATVVAADAGAPDAPDATVVTPAPEPTLTEGPRPRMEAGVGPRPPTPTRPSPPTTNAPPVLPVCGDDPPCTLGQDPFCEGTTYVTCEAANDGCPSPVLTENAPECALQDPACGSAAAQELCSDGECTGPEQVCALVDVDLGSATGPAVAVGDTTDASSNITASCASGARSPDWAYLWSAPETGCYQFDLVGSSYDTAFYVWSSQAEELSCNDDHANSPSSGLALNVEQGERYLLVVDGYANENSGYYELNINPCAEVCDDLIDNDADELVDCLDVECSERAPCIAEDCGSGLDDDGDGLVDCADSDCMGQSVCIEICDDLVDNDVNGEVDCGDVACAANAVCQVCPTANAELASALGQSIEGTTLGSGRHALGSCASSESEDQVFLWTAPQAACVTFDTIGSQFDTVLHVHSDCPSFTELACSDDDLSHSPASRVSLNANSGETYVVIVDGFGSESTGTFVLNVDACWEDCSNNVDDNFNGLVDCADSECAQQAHCVFEICDNGLDDDADNATDCTDSDCDSELACFVCPIPEQDLGSQLGVGLTSGSTVGAASALESQGCSAPGNERVFSWTAPAAGCYRFDTEGSNFDTVLHVHGSCPEFAELSCDDDVDGATTSELELELEAGVTVQIVVDGFSSGEGGDYTLSIAACL